MPGIWFYSLTIQDFKIRGIEALGGEGFELRVEGG
jgi:hypothetical protein